jgi:DNA-binding LacI/PurR family transcriptional regulator
MASTLQKAKYQRIAHSLREQIRNGDLRPGDRLPSFSEMHAQHGATTTTVERSYTILQQEGLVKREKGRGVFVAEPERPRSNAPIGLIGFDVTASMVSHPWREHLLEGIYKVTRQAGKEIMILPNLENSPDINWDNISGVLSIESRPSLVTNALPIGKALVCALNKVEGAVSIIADEASGIRNAMEHLVSLGHERIAYLITHKMENIPYLLRRVTAYQNALRAAGIEPDKRWLRHLPGTHPSMYREQGNLSMRQWLADDWKALGCTALLVQNDDTAIGAMQALQQADIRIPEELSIVGFDGTAIGKYCTPHLTSVALPLEEIGQQAMQSLLQQIEGSSIPFSTLELPTKLIVRASTTNAPKN